MKLLDLSLPTPAENLALDEAILEQAEVGTGPGELLRLWEMPQPCVVLGRSSRAASEVNLANCREKGIPVLRRCSGGAAIVAGPGCFMYSVVLSYRERPGLRVLERAHQFVLGVVAQALATIVPGVEMLGTSDLTLEQRKISGNSLRCRRNHLLYHGTILYAFPLHAIVEYLGLAPRQPDYRQQRDHRDFVVNFGASRQQLHKALCDAWSASETIKVWPEQLVHQLVRERYSQDSWNLRL
jgi:lipoate-protein ligase A